LRARGVVLPLEVCEKRLVLFVWTDPEPNNYIVVFDQADHSIASSDSRGVNRLSAVNAFEVQAGMMWIREKAAVGAASLLANV